MENIGQVRVLAGKYRKVHSGEQGENKNKKAGCAFEHPAFES